MLRSPESRATRCAEVSSALLPVLLPEHTSVDLSGAGKLSSGTRSAAARRRGASPPRPTPQCSAAASPRLRATLGWVWEGAASSLPSRPKERDGDGFR